MVHQLLPAFPIKLSFDGSRALEGSVGEMDDDIAYSLRIENNDLRCHYGGVYLGPPLVHHLPDRTRSHPKQRRGLNRQDRVLRLIENRRDWPQIWVNRPCRKRADGWLGTSQQQAHLLDHWKPWRFFGHASMSFSHFRRETRSQGDRFPSCISCQCNDHVRSQSMRIVHGEQMLIWNFCGSLLQGFELV